MVNLEISNYSPPYVHLNGSKKMDVTPLDLARSLVMIGRQSWTGVFNLGIFRIGELICKALAFTSLDKGNLILLDRFYSLNQSEKVPISYYFGQALTKLYAEKYLGVKWLLHVDDMATIGIFARGTALPKFIVGKTTKVASRPDLIGIINVNTHHIFESKGHSGKGRGHSVYDTATMQHAINQVSQVRVCNGVAPRTRAACFFSLSSDPIKGRIIDPESNEEGLDLKLSERLAIDDYYQFFKENSQLFNVPHKVNGYEFLTTQVGVPHIHFGFDKRILEMNSSELLEKGLYPDDFGIDKSISQANEVSVGLDGIIIWDKKDAKK